MKIFWGGAEPPPETPFLSANSALDLWCPFQMDWTPALVESVSRLSLHQLQSHVIGYHNWPSLSLR